MLSLDLFDSRYERQLREGAVDDLEARRIDDLNMRMLELLDRAKEPAYRKNPDALAGLKRQFQKIKAERDSYFKINPATGMDPTGSLGTTKGKLDEVDPPQRPPAKGLLKNKDLITPQQRVTGATPAKPGVAGAVKDVAGGIKRWLKGEPDQGPTYESIDEQDNIDKFGPPQGSINPADQPASNPALSGQMVVQILANAWDDKKPYVDIPYPGGNVTMSRAKIYDVLITLRNMSESKLNKIVGSIFTDRSAFLLWSSQLKRLNTPVEKNPPTPPGQMKLFREADGQKKNLKDQDDEVDTPQNLAVQRYLTRVRRKHPAATSDVEAMAKDEMEKQATTDQTIKDLKSVNIRQDAALKKAMSLDRQQGDEIDDIEKQIDQLGQKIQIIKKGKPTSGVDATAPAKVLQQPVQPSISTDKPATTRAVAPNLDRDATASAAAAVPVTDRALTDKVQNLEKQIQQNQQQGDPENKVRSLLTQLDQAQKALNTQIASLGAMQQKSDSSTQGLIDLFPKEKSTTKPRGKLKSPKQDKPEDLDLAKSLLKKFKAPAAVTEHGGGIGPRQHWQDLMQETVTDVRPLWADVYRRLAPKIERHRDSFLAGQLYDELENIAELHGAEGEFKRMMNGARNRAHMEYDTNPGGFQNWFWFLPFEDEQVEEGFEYASKVQHPKYGSGQVVKVYSNGMITVNFPTFLDPIDKKPGVQTNFMPGDAGYNSLKSGMTESTDDVKKRMSKLEALALAANRAGDDAKCKMYQQKIQSLKQKLSQSMNEFDASGYDRYSIYMDDYDLKEKFSDLDDAVDAIEAYKRDDPKSRYADYNVRDLDGKVVWRNDAWQDVPKPGKIQFLPRNDQGVAEATGDSKFDAMMSRISKDPWTQLNSDPNWEYEIEELVAQHIEPWLLAMERSGMPITRDEETLNPGWRKRYEQVANQLAQNYLASKKLNPRDPDLLGKIRFAIDWHTDESKNVHGQLSAYSDLPMQRYASAFDADGMTANMRDAMVGFIRTDDDDDDEPPTRPMPDNDPRRLDPGNMEEGWSDAMMSQRTGQPRTPYSVYIKGKKWKDFENDDHAEAVANKLRAKFKADGRDPETITIAPTDMSEGVKSGAAATALAACIAAGGTLSGCATNPSVDGAIGTVRDVGTAAKTASTMTRAGVQDELSQELRNFIRAQGGDPGSQNLSLLYKLQKRLQGQKDSQPINEVKDTEAVEQAIIKRIMVAHRDMLVEYGPEKIMSAASDVAYNVGDIGEMGDSDIGGWVNQVRQILGVVNETKTRLDPKCWTGKKIGNPKTKVKGGVRVNNCVPAESVEEGLKDPEDNPCWKGYKPVGTKKKAGKTVPNCVPVKEATNGAQ